MLFERFDGLKKGLKRLDGVSAWGFMLFERLEGLKKLEKA